MADRPIGLADLLVGRGVPLREAHETVGRLLLAVERSGRSLAELSDEALAAAFDPARSMARRATSGGTAPEAVRFQLPELGERLR